jgi:SOS response regulatory protein OraA/RecX
MSWQNLKMIRMTIIKPALWRCACWPGVNTVGLNLLVSCCSVSCQKRLLSDERFAEAYARQRIEAGYGLLRITGELMQRGVSENADTLQTMSSEDWCDQVVRLRRKRFGLLDLRGQLEERLRQMRFLQRRGFTHEQINAALDAVEPA